MLLMQLEMEIACVHSVHRLAMSYAEFQFVFLESCRPCSAHSKENCRIAAESVIYLKQRCSMYLANAHHLR